MMAEAPKSTKKDGPDAAQGAKPAESGPARKTSEGPIEDAEVIGETPPKAAKPAPAAASGSKPAETPKAAETSKPAETAKTTETAKKPAAETQAAKPFAENAKSSSEPAKSNAKPADKLADKPADKPAGKPTAKSDAKPAAKPAEKPKTWASGGPKASTAKPVEPAPAQVKSEPEKRRGSFGAFLGFLLGGIAAAVIGFVAARTVVPEGWPFPGVAPEEDPLVGEVEAQGAKIATLEENLSGVGAALEELRSDTSGLDSLRADLTARLDGIETGMGDLSARLDEVETRLAAVEKLAPEGSAAAEAAAEAYDRELTALRKMFEGELAKVEAAQADAATLEAQAAEAAQASAGRAALARVDTALESGEPFEDALAGLAEATRLEAPEALSELAADGAPTLPELQAGFAPAARAAIDAAVRAGVEDGSVGRMQAFLRTQLGTRSLEPKEGDDADAVLSRAEAALDAGDLEAALGEIDVLPEAAQPAMAKWRAEAETRLGALAASAGLAQELNNK